jgi:hypothetical protein
LTFQSDLEARVRYEGAIIAGRARERLEQELQRAAPVGTSSPYQDHEPGQLRDSIAVNVRFDQGGLFTFHAVADVPYASFTNTGTPAHPIVAVNTRALRFEWNRGGLHPAFFRSVSHPGTAETKWWDKVIDRWPDILAASQ